VTCPDEWSCLSLDHGLNWLARLSIREESARPTQFVARLPRATLDAVEQRRPCKDWGGVQTDDSALSTSFHTPTTVGCAFRRAFFSSCLCLLTSIQPFEPTPALAEHVGRNGRRPSIRPTLARKASTPGEFSSFGRPLQTPRNDQCSRSGSFDLDGRASLHPPKLGRLSGCRPCSMSTVYIPAPQLSHILLQTRLGSVVATF